MLNRSNAALCDFTKMHANDIYSRARDLVVKALKKMNATLNKKLGYIKQNVEQKLYEDLKAMINVMTDEEGPLWMENKKKGFQALLLTELDTLDAAWGEIVKDPVTDLRARNPLNQRPGDVQNPSDSDSEESDFSESELEDDDGDDESNESH
jgi:hypothetical protein